MFLSEDPYFGRFQHVRDRLAKVGYQFNFEGLKLSRLGMSKKSLRGANFSNAELFGADFSDADLRGANFSSASLKNCDFRGADLSNADLSSADLERSLFDGADLTSANLDKAKLFRASLVNAKVSDAKFASASLYGTDVEGVDFREAQSLTGFGLLSSRNVDKAVLDAEMIRDIEIHLSDEAEREQKTQRFPNDAQSRETDF